MRTEKEFNTLFGTAKPVIGMIHLLPLPGSPLYQNTGLAPVIANALKEASVLLGNGINALNIENYNDMSYFPNVAPPETVASLAICAHEIRKAFPKAVLGICALSDPTAGIAIAHAIQAQFIRATFFTEASVDVSGVALREPHAILRYRKFLDPSVRIFADVHIKHSAPLARRPIEESAYDAAYFQADAVIVSGKHTGFPTPIEDVKKVREVLPDFPLLIGSGANKDSVKDLFAYASGAFIGTAMKVDGKSENPVDERRVKDLMKTVKEIRSAL